MSETERRLELGKLWDSVNNSRWHDNDRLTLAELMVKEVFDRDKMTAMEFLNV